MNQPEITIGEAYANAADAVEEQRTPYPPAEEDQRKPSLLERWAQFLTNRRRKWITERIRRNRKLLDELPDAAIRERAEATKEFNLRLQEIAMLEKHHASIARMEIIRAEFELTRLEC